MKIPQYQQSQSLNPMPSGRQNINVNASMFTQGAQQTQEMGRAISTAGKAFQARDEREARAAAAEAKAREAEAAKLQKATDALRTESAISVMESHSYQATAERQQVKGENVAGLASRGEEALEARYKEQFDSLENDNQKIALQSWYGKHKPRVMGAMSNYEVRESNVHADNVSDARIGNLSKQILVDRNNPENVGASMNSIKASIASRGARKGWSTEQLNDKMNEAFGVAYADLYEAYISDGNFGKAKQVIKEAEKLGRITKVAKKTGMAAIKKAETKANNIVAGQKLAAMGVKEKQAHDYIYGENSKIPAIERDALWKQVEGVYSDERRFKAADQKAASEEVDSAVVQAQSNGGFIDLGQIPQSLVGRLSPEKIKAVTKAATIHNKGVSEDNAYVHYAGMAQDNRAAFKDTPWALIKSAVNTSDASTLQKLWKNPSLTGNRSESGLFKKALGAFGLGGVDPDMMGDEGSEGKRAFHVQSIFRSKVDQMKSDLGRDNLTVPQLHDVLDEMVMNKVYSVETLMGVDEFYSDALTSVSLLSPDELKTAYAVVDGEEVRLSQISGNQRKDIITSLNQQGKDVTEQSIAEEYIAIRDLP